MLPSSFTSVSLLNFWQVFRSGKALPSINRITKIMPALDHCLMRVSSLILVMLLLNLWLYTTQNIFAYRSDLRTLQDIELTHCQGKNSSFSQTEGGTIVASFGCQAWNHGVVRPHNNSEDVNSTGWIWLNPLINVTSQLVTWALVLWSDGSLNWTE